MANSTRGPCCGCAPKNGNPSSVSAKVPAQLKAGTLMGLESSSGQTERIARSLAIWGRVPEPAETAARLDAVTREDLRRYAETLIARRPAMALYGPVDGAPSLEALIERLAA